MLLIFAARCGIFLFIHIIMVLPGGKPVVLCSIHKLEAYRLVSLFYFTCPGIVVFRYRVKQDVYVKAGHSEIRAVAR